MSESTAQPATPCVSESPAPAAALIAPRLAVPVEEAAREIQNQLKIGSAIRAQRIRNRWELDQARTEKQEWVGRTTELLIRLFSGSTAIADECNDWVAPILPEFAELEGFIELFDNEMKHRIGRLKAVGKRLVENPAAPQLAAPNVPPEGSPTMITNPQPSQVPPVTHAVAPSPEAPPSAETRARSTVGGALILRAADEQAKTRVCEFLSSLGLFTILVDRTAEKPERSLVDEISHLDQFAVVLAGDSQSNRSAFELGVCVGRLGHARVGVLSRSVANQTLPDELGISHIVMDDADAWHLHVARHLRRGGIDIDLNKLA